MSYSRFPDSSTVRLALEFAINHPTSVTSNQHLRSKHNQTTFENELHTDTFTIGRQATLTAGMLGNARTICCRTFISLGVVEIDTLKVFADYIIFVNKVHTTQDLEFKANETFASVGCVFSGDAPMIVKAKRIWFTRPIINHHVEYEEIKARLEVNGVVEEQVIKRTKTAEWHEDPIDASVRDIRKELDRQDDFDLYQFTKEVVQSMGLKTVLI